jgi:DEAD/DEAH box helicase domain-containing protein
MFEVIFDVETKRFFDEIDSGDPSELGVSIVSVYSRTLDDQFEEVSGKMESFWEKEIPLMWERFQRADRVVGFNSVRFDVPVLSPYADFPLEKLPHFDILEKVKEAHGRRIKLDVIARDTLGSSKSDHGANAVKYFKSGDKSSLERLRKYCEMDVEITRDIYDFGLKRGILKLTDHWNTPREITVDFSYPQDGASSQIGLF